MNTQVSISTPHGSAAARRTVTSSLALSRRRAFYRPSPMMCTEPGRRMFSGGIDMFQQSMMVPPFDRPARSMVPVAVADRAAGRRAPETGHAAVRVDGQRTCGAAMSDR